MISNKLTLLFIAQKLNLDPEKAKEAWAKYWDESIDYKPFAGKILPDISFFENVCNLLSFPMPLSRIITNAYKALGRKPYLVRLFQNCHYLLFKKKVDREEVIKWPVFNDHYSQEKSLFYLFVYLAGVPQVFRINRNLNISDEITVATIKDIELWIKKDNKTGNWYFSNLGWLWFHFQNRLFSLGRLQFCIDTYNFNFIGIKNHKNNFHLIAPGNEIIRKKDGQFNGTSAIYDSDVFTTKLLITKNYIKGHVVSKNGVINHRANTFILGKNNWKIILRKGDKAISVHIPATGKLTEESVKNSFFSANQFFKRHFPEFKFNVFFSVSWLFDNNLPAILPPDSNIVKFQKIFYLFPIPGASDSQMWERVFDKKPANLNKAAQNTSLQKAIIRHVKNGGHFHIQGGILLHKSIKNIL